MSILVEVPHKVLFSGSYTILDGYPALAFAVEPRLSLRLTPSQKPFWPRDNPFAQAVRERLLTHLQQHHPNRLSEELLWGQFQTSVSMPIDGWGVGSSAAFTTALVFAQTEAWGLSLPPKELCYLARSAHRLAQDGRGSGIDVAACSLGGVVFASQSHTDAPPFLQHVDWPRNIGFMLIRSGNKADTRKMISIYRASTQNKAYTSRRALLRSIGDVCRTLLHNPSQFLEALQENARCEHNWSLEIDIPLVTEYQLEIQAGLSDFIDKHWVVIKALGAGGGDSIGCFYRTDKLEVSDLVSCLHDVPLQVRPTAVQTHGAIRIKA